MNWVNRLKWVPLAGLVLVVIGCNSAPPPVVYVMPTDQQCQALASDIESGIAKMDSGPLHRALDWSEIAHRTLDGIELPKSGRDQISRDIVKNASGMSGFETEILKNTQNAGSFRLLRLHDKDGTKRAMFRFATAGGGVNYYDLVLGLKDNAVRIVDIHVLSSGELISETLHRDALAVAAELNKNILEKLNPAQSDFVKAMPQLTAMRTDLKNGNFRGAVDAFHTLPDSLKQTKNCLMERFIAAQRLGPTEWTAAVDDMRKFMANDPCLYFVMIDYHTLRQEFQQALEAVDKLDAEVNDPYLNVMRANIYTAQGNLKEAMRCAQLAKDAGFVQ